MAGGYGPSPFSNYADFKAWHQANRGRRKVQYAPGTKLAIGSGYSKKPKRPPTKQLIGTNGNLITTPDVIDFDDWLDIFEAQGGDVSELYSGSKKHGKYGNIQNLADLADYAFNVTKGQVYTVKPTGGHILQLDYSPHFQVLRVHFEKHGNVVCYFYVPKSVFATLEALADSPQTRMDAHGIPRHLVGIYFWDLIRVRGTLHGNRYNCIYVEGGSGYTQRSEASRSELEALQKQQADKTRELAEKLKAEGQDAAAETLMGEARDIKNRKQRTDLTPQEQAARDDYLEEYKEDPLHPIKLELEKEGTGEYGMRNILVLAATLNAKAEKVLTGEALDEFKRLGRRREEDEDQFSGLLRQEDFLVNKGLWPLYIT